MSAPFTMPEGDPESPEDAAAAAPGPADGLGLSGIESQIDDLIAECRRLREENLALKERLGSLSGECARLVERSEAVRSRVETMIARLRAMEES